MIAQIIESLGGLEKSYIDAKNSLQNNLRINYQLLQWFLFSLNNFAVNCRLFKSTGRKVSFKRKLKLYEFRSAFILPKGENSVFF